MKERLLNGYVPFRNALIARFLKGIKYKTDRTWIGHVNLMSVFGKVTVAKVSLPDGKVRFFACTGDVYSVATQEADRFVEEIYKAWALNASDTILHKASTETEGKILSASISERMNLVPMAQVFSQEMMRREAAALR